MSQNVPTHETHQPIQVTIPTEDDTRTERGPMPTPSLWQVGVKATHKATRREVVVRVIDHKTNQFRAVGDDRTTWQACAEWDVLVELTPQERKKDEARLVLQDEIASLDAEVLPLVEVLCDDADPEKALAKLRAMRRAGMLGAPPSPAAVAAHEQFAASDAARPKRTRKPKVTE